MECHQCLKCMLFLCSPGIFLSLVVVVKKGPCDDLWLGMENIILFRHNKALFNVYAHHYFMLVYSDKLLLNDLDKEKNCKAHSTSPVSQKSNQCGFLLMLYVA